METPGLLLSRGLPAYHPSLTSGSLIIQIWSVFLMRWGEFDGCETSFDDDFAQCRDLTSVALEHGAPIDKFITENGDNFLERFEMAIGLQPDRSLQLLRYFQQLGVDIEHRDNGGRTPLLAAIIYYDDDYPDLVSTYLKANANLGAVDNMGRGYLRIALERNGFLFGDSKYFNFIIQARLLVTLLSADPRFKERAIKPNETPRLIELAFSAVAWEVWTWVFEKLNWDMYDMNLYRKGKLDQPLPSYLEKYEEARLQMLGQTEFRLNLSL